LTLIYLAKNTGHQIAIVDKLFENKHLRIAVLNQLLYEIRIFQLQNTNYFLEKNFKYLSIYF